MIFGNMDHVEEFPYLEKGIKECFEYAKTHDLCLLYTLTLPTIA